MSKKSVGLTAVMGISQMWYGICVALLLLTGSIEAAADSGDFSETQSIYTRWNGTPAADVQTTDAPIFYLYNVGTGRFLVAGGLWGTEGMLLKQDYGMPFTWQTDAGGRTYIKSNVTTADGAYALSVNKDEWTTQKSNDHYVGVQLDGRTNYGFNYNNVRRTYTVSTALERVAGETGTGTYTYNIKVSINSSVKGNGTFYIGAGEGDEEFRGLDHAAYKQLSDNTSLKDNAFYQWRLVTQAQFIEALNASNATEYDGLNANVSFLLHDIFFDRGNLGFSNWKVESSETAAAGTDDRLYDWSFQNLGKKDNNTDANRFITIGATNPTFSTAGIGRISTGLKWNTAVFRKIEPVYDATYGWQGKYDEGMQKARYEFGALEGQGSAYQTVTFSKAGNYVLSCEGFSSDNDCIGQLFVQKDEATEVLGYVNLPYAGTSVELYHQGATQGSYYATTVNAREDWPAAGKLLYDNESGKYSVEVVFNVSDADVSNSTAFRVGIKKDQAKQSYKAWDDGNSYYFDQSYVAIDNMELHYLGDTTPFLLDEDQTPFYSIYTTAANETAGNNTNRTVYLKRTMTAGKWTSITLPVPLSTAQFYSAFGDGARLGTLSGVGSETPKTTQQTRIDFRLKKLDPDGVAMYADSFYLIRPTIQPTTVAYSDDNSSTETEINVYLLGRHNLELEDVGNNNRLSPLEALTRGLEADGDRSNYYQLKYEYGGYLKNDESIKEGEGRAFTIYGTYTSLKENAYTDISQTAPSPMQQGAYYVASDGNMYHIGSSNYRIQGFRGWLVANSKEATSKGISFNIVEDDPNSGTATSIKVIDLRDGSNGVSDNHTSWQRGVFALSGQHVAGSEGDIRNLPKGIYIVNGQKMVVK